MHFPASPVAGIVAARDVDDDRALRRAVAKGELLRIRRGAFVSAPVWAAATPRRRSVLRIAAIAASRGHRDVFSHASAAVLAGLDLISEPTRVHVTDPCAATTRTLGLLVVHAGIPDPHLVESPAPFRRTGLARTLADVAISSPFPEAVAVIDSGLRAAASLRRQGELRAAVEREIVASGRVRGVAGALRALAFADPGAANAGESLSRVVVHQLGFVPPTSLQEPFRDDRGLIGRTDFWWREVGVVGEFDGFVKYSKPEYLKGRSPSEVVVEEKARERRLEALPEVNRVARWVRVDLDTPSRLFSELAVSGVPRR